MLAEGPPEEQGDDGHDVKPDEEQPGDAEGAKKKHKKKGGFKPGGEAPWQGKSSGRPGFGVKGKKKRY